MRYVIRLWLLTVLLSPVLWQLLLVSSGVATLHNITARISDFVSLLYIGGLLISIPVFCVFYLFYSMILQQSRLARLKKIRLTLLGVVLVGLSFFLFDSGFFTEGHLTVLLLPVSYMIVLVSVIWFVSLPVPGQKDIS